MSHSRSLFFRLIFSLVSASFCEKTTASGVSTTWKTKVCVFSLALAFWGTSVTAGEWPRFRGPNGAGLVEDVSIHWNDDSLTPLWQKELPGTGAASPIVRNGKIYIASASPETAVHVVQCLKTSDGTPVWQKELQGSDHKQHRHNDLAVVTPAMGEDALFYVFYEEDQLVLVALNLAEGKEIWRASLGSLDAEHGHGASPIHHQGRVFFVHDQNGKCEVFAYEATSGKLAWKTEMAAEEAGYATPCMMFDARRKKHVLITNTWGSGVSALDPQTGKVFWSMPGVMEFRVTASPVCTEDRILISGGMGGTGRQMLAVEPPEPLTEGEPKIVYEIERPFPYVPTPVVKGDLLYTWADRGEVICRKASSGELIWEENLDGSYYSSPIILGDAILGISRKGLMSVLSLETAPEERVLWQKDFEAPVDASPAFVDGVLYVRTEQELMAFSVK